MQKTKRVLAWLLVLLMVFTVLPVQAASMEVTTELSSEVTTAVSETTTEGKTEETTTAQNKETTTVQATTQEATEQQTVAGTEEVVSEQMETQQEETESEVVSEQETTATRKSKQSEEPKEERLNAKEAADSPVGTVLNSGSWGAGYKWFVYQGKNQAKHYVFCLEHGATMYSGAYSFTEHSGVIGSPDNTFRIAVAMDYFKQHGGWGSEEGYETGQRVVWNTGGTAESNKLIRYANNLWQLTSLNTGRKAGGSSYSGSLTPVSGTALSDAVNAKAIEVSSTNGVVKDKKIDLPGTAWKYFASGANGMGGIQVAGIYTPKNTKPEGATASVEADGTLKVSFTRTEDYGNEDNPLTIIMKVNATYGGATSIGYLNPGNGKQKMSFDSVFSAPAYFAIKVFTKPTEIDSAQVSVNKVDELGQVVSGAVFQLKSSEIGINYESVKSPIADDASSMTFASIEKAGTYYLKEIKAPDGMMLNPQTVEIKAEEVTEGTTKKIKLSIPSRTGNTVGSYIINGDSTDTFLSFSAPDSYDYGSAVLHKVGNVFVKWEHGEFVYLKRDLDNVTFSLYTAQDIYLGDTLLWSAGTELTQEVVDASLWNSKDGNGIKKMYHPAAEVGHATDPNGRIYYNNLPIGSYYVVETASYEGYGVLGTRLDFAITSESKENPVQINNGEYENKPVYGHCTVKKLDKNGNVPLQGAEFTLYANVNNTNFDGYPLFTVEDTVPAIISRNREGEPTEQSHTWVPVASTVSGADGLVDFEQPLPYGTYMVVETNPPEGYAYSAGDSWVFQHTTTTDAAEYSTGKVFYKEILNEKTECSIQVVKHGEVLTDAETKTTEYGTYRSLVFDTVNVKGVEFALLDSDHKWIKSLKTDEKGEAESGALEPGVYYIKETGNGGSMTLDTAEKKVILKAGNQKAQTVEVVEFDNRALDTELRIYKTAEVPEQAENGYQYTVKPAEGVVFALFAKDDITNYDGTVVVKADSCVGYCVTDAKGIAQCRERLVNGTYYWKEIKAKDDTYILDEEIHAFTIHLSNESLSMDLTNPEQPLLNKKYKGTIKVIKTDGKTTIPMEHVTFVLYDERKTEIGQYETDKKGELTISDLPIGIYYVKETKTLKEYKLDDTMHEIDLTKEKLEQVLELTNDREEQTTGKQTTETITTGEKTTEKQTTETITTEKKTTESQKTRITVTTDTTVSGHGSHAKTGDTFRKMVWLLFGLAVSGIIFLKRKKGLFVLFVWLFVAGSAGTVQASEATSVEVVELKVDGISQRVEETEQIQYYGERITAVTVETENSVRYEIRQQGNDWNAVATPLRVVDYTVPNTVTVECMVAADAQSVRQTIQASVEKVVWNADLMIPENSNVKTVYLPQNYLHRNQWIEYLPKLTCYKKDVELDFDIGLRFVETNYRQAAEHVKEDILVYYQSLIARELRSIQVLDGEEYKPIEPSYVSGMLLYELNGGTNAAENPVGYPIGGETLQLYEPTRKDYKFTGWYTDKNLAGSTKAVNNRLNSYAMNTNGEPVTVYAGWEYCAYVTRDGIHYIIGPAKTATVLAGDYSGTVRIPEQISYEGRTYPVTKISSFSSPQVKEVYIPKSIVSIESGAFTQCPQLTDIYMDSMTLTLGTSCNPSIRLHAYADSLAYTRYEAEGYTGEKVPYSSPIVYELDGGINHEENPAVYQWKTILQLQPAQKEGYRFDGWYADRYYRQQVTSIQEEGAPEIVVYAKFTRIPKVAEVTGPDKEAGNTTEMNGDATGTNGNVTGTNETGASGTTTETITGNTAGITGSTSGRIVKTTEKVEFLTTANVTEKNRSLVLKKVTVKNTKGKALRITIKADGATGCQVQISKNRKMQPKKTKTAKQTTCTIKKLQKGKTYYVRVRACGKNAAGKNIYSSWSAVKKVTIKQKKK